MGIELNAILMIIAGLLALGYGILAVLYLVPASTALALALLPLLLSETLIAGLTIGLFWIGGWLLALALLIFAARVGYEAGMVALLRMADPAGRRAMALALGAALAGLCLAAAMLPTGALAALVLLLFLICLGLRLLARPGPAALIGLDLALFPALPLVLFVATAMRGDHVVTILITLILVETFDSYALFGGKLLGRTRAFPTLSPKKTVEGLVTGAVMLMLTAALVGAILGVQSVWASMAVALLAGALTVAGDLAASRLKRAGGVKDYPPVLAHHGGVLDITDSWIATCAGMIAAIVLLGAG